MRILISVLLLFSVMACSRQGRSQTERSLAHRPLVSVPLGPPRSMPKLPAKMASKPLAYHKSAPHLLPPIPITHDELIVIDAGHGGKDTGARSVKNGYEEKSLTLKTAQVVKTYLENLGYNVALTRTDDAFVELGKRAEMANELKADLFVSIHYNYSENSSAEGIEIFYFQDDKNPFSQRLVASKKLGEEMLRRIVKHTGASPRGVKRANFAVIRETKMPAILIEGGFLSNGHEREKIKEEHYRCYLAFSIARAIDHYLTVHRH